MNEERPHLQPLADEGFDLAGIHFPRVNHSGCVRVLTNFYSTPVAPGTEVEVKVYAAYVEIWHEGRRVARHERCFSRQQKVLDLEHYLEALTKKPGALAGSTPLEQWRQQGRWPASYDRFWEQLRQRRGPQEGTRAMVELLQMGREHGWDQLRAAVEQAVEWNCWNVAAVRYLLVSAEPESRIVIEPVEIGWLSRYERPQPTVANYDQLLRVGPVAGEVIQ